MRIMQVIPELCFGGAETMCTNLSIELKKMGHEVVLVSLYTYKSDITDRLIKNGIQIVYLDKKAGLNLGIIKKLMRVMKEFNPDVVHTHLYAAKYAHIAATLTHVNTRIHTVHTVAMKDGGSIERRITKFIIKHMNVIPVSLSSIVQKTVVDEYGIRTEKTPVIFNGVPLDCCRKIKQYKDRATRFVHIGRFSEAKNHLALIEAFIIAHQKEDCIELFFYGEGEKRDECVKLVNDHNADGYIHFCGVTGDIYSVLEQADVFILPSLWEGVPMTLIEAMGTALPIITTPVGGIVDMLEDGKEAVFTGTDSKSIADSISMVVNNTELRQTLGHAALTKSEQFSAKKMAEKYLALYLKGK